VVCVGAAYVGRASRERESETAGKNDGRWQQIEASRSKKAIHCHIFLFQNFQGQVGGRNVIQQ
jgi:hypothetical protein